MTSRVRLWVSAGLLALLMGVAWAWIVDGSPPTQVRRALRAELDRGSCPSYLRSAGNATALQVLRFYRARDFRPAWTREGGPSDAALQLSRILSAAAEHGDAPDGCGDRIRELLGRASGERLAPRPDPDLQAELDIRLTACALGYASHVLEDESRAAAPREWTAAPGTNGSVILLDDDTGDRASAGREAAAAPREPAYTALGRALDRYRQLAAREPGGRLTDGPVLRPGARGARVLELRRRLWANGDLPAAGLGNALFDPPLAAALARFQARHGLAATGMAGPAEVAALDVPLSARVRQIELNLERWRWMPEWLGDRYVLVNVPDSSLVVMNEGRRVLTDRVVPGPEFSRAPVASDRITQVVFAPPWAVPSWLALGELVPRLRADPSYGERHHLRVFRAVGESGRREVKAALVDWSATSAASFPYELVQEPGPWNPMGAIRFDLAETPDLRLHATPAGGRGGTGGCLRLVHPERLATYLLGEWPGWNARRVASLVASGRHLEIGLPHPVSIHVVYWTAWVAPGGAVQFRPDVYGIDHALEQALDRVHARRLAEAGSDAAAGRLFPTGSRGDRPSAVDLTHGAVLW